jgi:high-affinity Fe2+/Pb2+ permease
MGTRTIWILAAIVLVIALLQKTPLAFLPEGAADFTGGLAIGLAIGALIAWMAGRSGKSA